MPELPEVETVRRGLERVTLNQQIEGGDVLLSRTIAHPIPVTNFLAELKGASIIGWHRRGKYLLAELASVAREQLSISTQNSKITTQNSRGWLGVHLRMTGQLLWLDRHDPLQKHTRVRLFFEGNRELRFVDQRTFGQMWWVPPTEKVENIITGLKKLGPDPFAPAFSSEYLVEKLQNRRTPIKTALLDQELVAGLGNIYADETLFMSRVQPTTPCTQLNSEQITRLHSAIRQVLQTAIDAGGTTFSNFLNVQGINGNYGGVAWVYKRAGEPCRVCNTPLQRVKLAGRSTHFCPECQGLSF